MYARFKWKKCLGSGLVVSTRADVAEIDAHHSLLWSLFYTLNMHQFHMQRVEPLTEDDYSPRVPFMQ